MKNPKRTKQRSFDIASALTQIDNDLEAKNYDSALRTADRLMERQPDEPYPFVVASHCLLMLGRPKEAERLLRQALRRFVDNARLLNNLGMALIQQHKPSQAEEHFRRALEVIPAEQHSARARTLCGLGEALWLLLRREEAIEHWKQAVIEDPHNEAAQTFLKKRVNEYGEPKARTRMDDDFYHFWKIHTHRYLEPRGMSKFESVTEADRILATIQSAWDEFIVPRSSELETMTAAEKTALFSGITIDFERAPPSKIIPLFPRKEADDAEMQHRRELITMLDNALPFLPPGGSGLVILAGMPALAATGMSWKRLKAFITGKGKATPAEQELFEWVFELVLAVMDAARLQEEGEDTIEEAMNDDPAYAILDAVEIATQRLPADEALQLVRVTYDLLVHGFPSPFQE